MKPLLSLLAGLLLIDQVRAHLIPSNCTVGNRTLQYDQKYERNAIRSDKCSGFTGIMDIDECRLPGKNKTISRNEKVQEVIDGVTNYYTCEAYGYEGITVTHTSTVQNTQIEGTSINPGVCNKGSMMWLPNQQWDEGDYVKKCNPDTLRVDVIACRSFEGTFIPSGSNRTTERFDESVGHVVSITECVIKGDEAHLKQVVHVRPTNDFEGCVEQVDFVGLVNWTLGEEKVVGTLVHACVKEATYRIKVIGCVSKYGNFIEIGENVTESQNIYHHNSFCLATVDGAKLEIQEVMDFYPPGAERPLTYPIRPVLTCGRDARNGNNYLEDDTFYLCQIDHRGRKNITIIYCLNKKPEIGQPLSLKLGETISVDGRWHRCDLSTDGKTAVLVDLEPTAESMTTTSPEAACANGKKLDEEWSEQRVGYSCKLDKSGKAKITAVGCYGADQVDGERYLMKPVPLGEAARVEAREVRCNPTKDGKAQFERVDLGSEPNCDGRRLNVTWDRNGNEFTCQLNESGKPTVKVIACTTAPPRETMETKRRRIPLGEIGNVWPQGRFKCVLTPNGTAKLEYVPATCEDVKRKIDEEWRDEHFVMKCVYDHRIADADFAYVSFKACIVAGIEIPVGENRTLVSGNACQCKRSGEYANAPADRYPARNATLECSRKDENNPEPEPLLPEPFLACDKLRRVNDTWREGISAYICKLKNNITVEPVIALTGCLDTENQTEKTVETPLGEIAFLGGFDRRCTMNEAGKAEWVLLENKCENGKMEGEEWNVSFVIKACERDHLVADRVVMIVVVKACVVENVAFPVGKSWKIPTGTCKCERTDGLTGAASVRSAAIGCVGIPLIYEPEITSTTARSSTTKKASSTTSPLMSEVNLPKRSASDCTMDDLHKERVDGDFVMACKSTTAVVLIKNVSRWIYTAIRCITPEGDKVLIGESKKNDLGAYKCAKSGRFPFAELTFEKKGKRSYACKKREGSATGQLLGEGRTENGVRRVCTDNLELEATLCFVPHDEGKENDALFFGEVYRGKKQYSCERRGEYDAELVVKSFSQLCEEGDMSVDAWVEEAVLRDCVRSGNKHTVHARMCVLGDGQIMEIGQFISFEFESWKCEKDGEFNAKFVYDQSKIHKQYFITPGTCKNGKKVGDEWTQNGVRRACRPHKKGEGPNAVIVDLGCEHFPGTPDSPLLAVGGKAEWASGVTGPITTLYCEAGKPFCAAVAHFGERERDTPDKVRECANGRFEGETWEAENVQRTCKEGEDKLQVVTMHCVVGNETLEIGQLWLTSESSSIECVRVGEHDAAAVVTLFHPYDKECENGKRISEDWTDSTDDGPIRKSCRVRDKRATIVILGCVLDDGRILEVGETDTKTNTEPGWELYEHTHCVKNADNVVKLVVTQDAALKEDKKNPCGENKYGAVWATKSFLKKCKVTNDNHLSAATIGCVTVKGTHMLEGQYLVEDDYNIKCSRNEDSKLEMHYSFTVTEK